MTGRPGSEDRLHGIEAITDTALARLDVEAMSEEMLLRVRDVLGVDTATVLQYDQASDYLVVTASSGIEEAVRQGVRIPFGLGFAGTIAATRKPLIIDHVDETTVLNPLLWDSGLQTMLGVPMLAGGRLTGVLHVGSREPRSFSDHDIDMLQLAADRFAMAAQAEMSHAERAAATALQRSLLPARLPVVPGFEFAARYVPSATFGVGGDWYDVFALPHERVGIVIGDVSGHGLASAVVMGRLRSALRAYALDNDAPSEVLTKLDRKAYHFETGAMATVGYGVIDLATNRIRLSLAGHLPPLLAVPDRTPEFVGLAPDPPIGFDLRARPRRTHTIDLPPGSSLCFYTDGLVERREASIDDGLELLPKVVSADRADITCARLMARFVGTRSLADDVAVLVAHRKGT
jgi:sigma-B regulation protein RsbU (phosphoserine phosphatase)